MPKFNPEDIIGNKCFYLTIKNLSYVKKNKYNKNIYFYNCICDCGNEKVICRSELLSKGTKSCGCYKPNQVIDLTNKKFGKLKVISLDKIKNHKAYWICKCDCGNEKSIMANSLTSGKTKSCGCLAKSNFYKLITKHGDCKTKLYHCWLNMKNRCYNPNSVDSKWYFEKGISICDEWMDYKNFKIWASQNGYKDGLTIERLDVNKNYCPENCTWIERNKQNNNKSDSRFITYNGQKKCLAEWIKELNLSKSFVYNRLRKDISFNEIVRIANEN